MKQKRPFWLILSQYYPPEIGAPQIRLSSLAKELRRNGIEVEVLTAMPNYPAGKVFPGYEGKWRHSETLDGVRVRRVWVYAATGKRAAVRLANYFSFTLTAAVAAFMGRKPDVMIVESQPLSLGLIGVALRALKGVPYIYNVPDLQVDVARQMGFMSNKMLLKVAFWLENLFLRKSWKVSTVTHRFIEHFRSRGIPGSQITFLPNGADGEFLRPLSPDDELLDRWKLRGRKVFLYVGTHAFYHGLETLIEAATLLRDRQDIAFLLIGDGPERERLKEMAQSRGLSNVVFGQSPYSEMARLYSIAYASVATLKAIGVAEQMRLSKIFPSLSCAVPVVYAGVGEAAELISASGCGLTVAPERPELLANAISKLAADADARNRMGLAGREMVENEYTWEIIVRRWLNEMGIVVNDDTPSQDAELISVAAPTSI
jgi:colanic acid biosynthesis glycosyl transferase WcaI